MGSPADQPTAAVGNISKDTKTRADNVMWKHAVNDHGGRDDVDYVMEVLKNYRKDNLTRKTNEAVRITNNEGVKLNSKAEFRQPTVPRLVIQRNRNE